MIGSLVYVRWWIRGEEADWTTKIIGTAGRFRYKGQSLPVHVGTYIDCPRIPSHRGKCVRLVFVDDLRVLEVDSRQLLSWFPVEDTEETDGDSYTEDPDDPAYQEEDTEGDSYTEDSENTEETEDTEDETVSETEETVCKENAQPNPRWTRGAYLWCSRCRSFHVVEEFTVSQQETEAGVRVCTRYT